MRHFIEHVARFFEVTGFGASCDGGVGGDHVSEMGFRSLRKGREKLENFSSFPTIAHLVESETQCHCAENKTWCAGETLAQENKLFIVLQITFGWRGTEKKGDEEIFYILLVWFIF